jgi:hypothetical protein
MDKTPKRDIKILMGDMNTKVGADNNDRKLTKNGPTRQLSKGERNENGELFTECLVFNGLVIGGIIFPQNKIHKNTSTSP